MSDITSENLTEEEIERELAQEESALADSIPKDDGKLWWTIESLPSGGKFYPEGTTIQGKEMDIVSVKALSTMNPNNANRVINEVIGKNIRGIEPEKLLVADKLHLVFFLRANTFPESDYQVPFECPHCAEPSATYNFNMDCLNISKVKDGFEPSIELDLPSGKKITLKLMTLKDESISRNYILKAKGRKESIDEEMLDVAMVINEVDGRSLSLQRKYTMLMEGDFTPRDFSTIINYMKYVDFGTDVSINVTCNHCKEASEQEVIFQSEFFLPEDTVERNPFMST